MIIHVDMDAYYASIEEREDPSLRARPLVVAGRAEQRGVVSAASYAARAYGIHSAMPTARALRMCRDLIVLPVRMPLYVDVSRQIRKIFHRFTPIVEPLSLDEAFLDSRASTRLYGSAVEVARQIKRAIGEELSLVASVGVAPNKFLAKLASDYDKPDGFTVIEPEAVRAFLDPLPVQRLWGVGTATLTRLHALDIHTIGDLRRRDIGELEQCLGRVGIHLHELAHGRDGRTVQSDSESKSVSHETTFAVDVSEESVLESVLMELTESVCARLRAGDRRGRTVTLKLRDDAFRTFTASRSLPASTHSTLGIWRVARDMLAERYRPGMSVRLIGIAVSRFDTEQATQIGLFADDGQDARIDEITDVIRTRFGRGAIGRGTGYRPG